MELTHGSLFSGIGGFDLGFERAGFRSVWQVEIDPYCRAVLAKHFPDAKRYEDVRAVGRASLEPVSVISGGFPCQDISHAGNRAGIEGSRSGLWAEYHRIICELRPPFVVVENVAALLGRGMGRVLGDLAESGYDAEWQVLSANAFGAPHIRERVIIVAYAGGAGLATDLLEAFGTFGTGKAGPATGSTGRLPQPSRYGWNGLVDTPRPNDPPEAWKNAPRQPWILGVPDGVSGRVERITALGNAIVPQIAEFIAHRIREAVREESDGD